MAHAGQPDIARTERAVRIGFASGFDEELVTPWMPLFENEPMSSKKKLIRDLLGVGLMEKEDGNNPTFHEDVEHNFEIQYCAYSVGHKMRLDDMSDDLDGILSATRTGRMLGIEAMKKKARDAYALISAGTGTTLGNCFDGGAFFRSDHPMDGTVFNDPNYDGPATQSNYTSGGGDPWVLLNLSPGSYKPFIYGNREEPTIKSQTRADSDVVFEEEAIRFKIRGRWAMAYGRWFNAHMSEATLDATNYEAARVTMQSLVDYRGQKLDIYPTHILVTPSNLQAARDLFSANLSGGGDTNTLRGDVQIISTALFS